MPHNHQPILQTRNLSKVFITGMGFAKSRLVAVNRAAFQMGAQGTEIFTIAGESGSGKSTPWQSDPRPLGTNRGQHNFSGQECD